MSTDDSPTFDSQNEGKEDFETIYNRSEPFSYFDTLCGLGYCMPQEAKPVFRSLIEAVRERRGEETITVLDVGCSYGVNGALLKHQIDLEELREHFVERGALPRPEAIEQDLRFIDSVSEEDPGLTVIGLDTAEQAVTYAEEVGLIDAGIVADLEAKPLPSPQSELVGDAELIISTGCVGYVTESTFLRLLSAYDPFTEKPWVASFVLRMFPYDSIASTLETKGLVTEKLSGYFFPQRRFANGAEQEHAIGALEGLGIDPTPESEDQRFYSEFFLSRPPTEARTQPLSGLLPATVLP